MKKKFPIANFITTLRLVLLVPFFIFAYQVLSTNEKTLDVVRNSRLNNIEILETDYTYTILQWVVVGVFALLAVLDLLDGFLARKFEQITNYGKIMDPIVDKLQICGTFILLNIVGILPVWVTIIVIVRDIWITGLRGIYKRKTGITAGADKVGKYKTLSQNITLGFFLAPLTLLPETLTIVAWVLLIICLVLTAWSAIVYSLKYIFGVQLFQK